MVQRLQRVTHSLKHSNENDFSISFEKRVVARLTESSHLNLGGTRGGQWILPP